MKTKLLLKALSGYQGGLEPRNAGEVMHRLQEHWQKFISGDRAQLVDVANPLMMLWFAFNSDAVVTEGAIRQCEEDDMPL